MTGNRPPKLEDVLLDLAEHTLILAREGDDVTLRHNTEELYLILLRLDGRTSQPDSWK